ncbi:hypothetical protein LJ737_18775 [Hymenobacter sp. 15J16-1T3B]|nr:hypothetical protein [Hymenobacter sp. 15J16-1T3B]
MERINWLELKASVQRALLFNIRPAVVCISIHLSEANEFFMRFQFDNEPTGDDKAMCGEAAGEVNGDFVDMKSFDVSFISSTAAYSPEAHYPTLVYARADS